MLEKFAINILDEVAESCDKKCNSFKTPEEKADLLDKVSKNLTDIVVELSREAQSKSK